MKNSIFKTKNEHHKNNSIVVNLYVTFIVSFEQYVLTLNYMSL